MVSLAFVLITLLAPGGATAVAVNRAPIGYEDETGFHFSEWAVPGSNGGAGRLLPLLLGTFGLVPDLLL